MKLKNLKWRHKSSAWHFPGNSDYGQGTGYETVVFRIFCPIETCICYAEHPKYRIRMGIFCCPQVYA